MTNYNDGKTIAKAINAVLSQSRPPDEFIIQDDGSTDDSVQIIESFALKYPIVKFVRNEKNIGAIPAMQKVMDYATGDYIYGASANDWVLPGFFETAMTLLEHNPQAGLCFGNPKVFDHKSGEILENDLLWSDHARYFSPDEIADIIAGEAIFGLATILRRDAFYEAGGFIAELKWHSDWFFTLAIAFRYGLVYIPQFVAVDHACMPGSYCWEGSQNWKQQSEVLANVLRLLKSPRFEDLLPYFMRGGVCNLFPIQIVRTVLSNKEFWDIESLLLIQQPLFTWNNQTSQIRNYRSQQALEKKVGVIVN
jgi:glycosyltransferase involved in cell wall biosynthesis